jgi:hypothetical protein
MSRYTNTSRNWVPHPTKGWVQVTFRSPNVWRSQAYTEHWASSADDMLSLAFDNYGDPSRYWGIAEMNPSIACPDDLEPGTILRMPTRPR